MRRDPRFDKSPEWGDWSPPARADSSRMPLLRACMVLLVLLASAAGGGVRASASSQANCSADYSYAGFDNVARAHGVAATITPLAAPSVAWGHVAGWVGVGGM